MSTGTTLGKGIEGYLRSQNPVSMETMSADYKRIKAFIDEETCFRAVYVHLSKDESRITLRTKI